MMKLTNSKDVIPESVYIRALCGVAQSGLLGEMIAEPGIPLYIVHGYARPLEKNDSVRVTGEHAETPYTIKAKTWFFWVDLAPQQIFAHRTLYVYVDDETMETTVIEKSMWPCINDQEWLIQGGDPDDDSTWIHAEEVEI